MIQAWPLDDGRYRLSSLNHSETYHKRDKIKQAGGQWDGKSWVVPVEALEIVGARKMVRAVAAAHCHESECEIWVTEDELRAGQKRLGCGLCDTMEICGQMVKLSKSGGERT